MLGLFYVLVLSVYVIGCGPNGKGNSNLKGLDPAYHFSTLNKDTPPLEERHRSQSGICPTGSRNANSTFYIERQASQPENLAGPRNRPDNPHADDGLTGGIEVSNQRPSASTGAVPRRCRPRTSVRQSPTPREECSFEDLYTTGASSCRENPGCARNCGSSSIETPWNPPRFSSSNSNRLRNNSERMPEEYGPHYGARSGNAASGSRTNETMIRTQTADGIFRHCLERREDDQRPEIRNFENVPDLHLGTNFTVVPLSPNNQQQENAQVQERDELHGNQNITPGASSSINPKKTQMGDRHQPGPRHNDDHARDVEGSDDRGDAQSLTIDLAVDPRAGTSNREINAEAFYRDRSNVLTNQIMADQTEFRRLFNELTSLVFRVTDMGEFRLDLSSTIALFDAVGSHLDSLTEAVEELGMYFIHDTINIARQQMNYFVLRFRELKKSFYKRLTTSTSDSEQDRQTVTGNLYIIITLSENVMKVVQNMLHVVAVYWERVDALS